MTTHEDAPAASIEPTGQLADPGKLTPADFDPFVGDQFRVTNQRVETCDTHVYPMNHPGDPTTPNQEVVNVTLVEVTRFSKQKEQEGGFRDRPREPFSLLFECEYSGLMPAGLALSHPQLGAGKFLFGPVGIPKKDPTEVSSTYFYEVVFG